MPRRFESQSPFCRRVLLWSQGEHLRLLALLLKTGQPHNSQGVNLDVLELGIRARLTHFELVGSSCCSTAHARAAFTAARAARLLKDFHKNHQWQHGESHES